MKRHKSNVKLGEQKTFNINRQIISVFKQVVSIRSFRYFGQVFNAIHFTVNDFFEVSNEVPSCSRSVSGVLDARPF